MSDADNPGIGDCDQQGPNLLSVTEAKRRILELVQPVQGEERVPVRKALGRVLTEEVTSPMDVPPQDNSAMDGYAFRATDLQGRSDTELEVVATAYAGAPYEGELGPGQAVRIMTGAPIPSGADTVVMQEQATREGRRVRIGPRHEKGDNVRVAGEDIQRGDVILTQGTVVGPAELGLLASVGTAEVTVCRRLRIAFFSTGDELRAVGQPLEPGQIYDSNRYTLHGMLQRLGVELMDMGVIADRREDVRRAFQEAAANADAVITSGGVSVGEADYVQQTLDELGRVGFWKIAMKPGKPLAVGTVSDAYFFGLPGNPVSVMATFYQFVQPALRHMMGAQPDFELTIDVPTASALTKTAGRLEYQRGILFYDDSGRLLVTTTGLQGSHVLTSMSRANCFIILPEGSEGAERGEIVTVQPFAGIV